MDEQVTNNGAAPQGGSGFSIASMVLGIVALILSCCLYAVSIPCALVGAILGVVALMQHKAGKGMAIAGLVCSVLSLIPAIIGIVFGAALLAELGTMG